VGTVDQALLGVVAAKHFFVRHFALAGKVVILDEIHSYDLYTGTLIDKLVAALEGLGCTVIVLSATLTGQRREQLVSYSNFNDETTKPYPLITGRQEGALLAPALATPPENRKVKVQFINIDDAMKDACELARSGGAVLWICNTIGTAQKQYQRFREIVSGAFPLGLLHSRFPFHRREALEKEWMERFGKDGRTRCGSILVSTQVVEQSVDLDADLLITELAPTDMLLQRIGRLWRHERGIRVAKEACLEIISESKSLEQFKRMSPQEIKEVLGRKSLVYDPYVLLRTLTVWHGLLEVNLPGQIRELIECTYDSAAEEPETWFNLFCDCEGKSVALRQKALMCSNVWTVHLPDEEGVQTRLNDKPAVSLVLCRAIDKQRVEFIDGSVGQSGRDLFHFKTAQAVHRNLVKVPEYCFDLSTHKASPFSAYLFGKQSVGLFKEDGKVESTTLKKEYRLIYSDEMGLLIEKTS
jgi:CRISPR-associated endonuclease/helicase Cas3